MTLTEIEGGSDEVPGDGKDEWAFILIHDGDGWLLKGMRSTAQLRHGARSVSSLEEATEQIRILGTLLRDDELTQQISQDGSDAERLP